MDNELKATPGPWEVAYEHIGDNGIFAGGVQIATAGSYGDALLIAAAPDMYDALQFWQVLGRVLLDASNVQFSTSVKERISSANLETRAALAKARGEASE